MKIEFHRNFKKQYKTLRQSDKKKFRKRLEIFMRDPFNPVLHNHPLHGKYANYRSINVSGNLRALYQLIGKSKAFFIIINSHSNLYS